MNVIAAIREQLAQRNVLKHLRGSLLWRAVLTNPTGFTERTTKSEIGKIGLPADKLKAIKSVMEKAPRSAYVVYDSRQEWFVVWYVTSEEDVLLVYHHMPEYHLGWDADSPRWLNFRSGNSPQARAVIKVFKKNYPELTCDSARVERIVGTFQETMLNE
ncbi:hypothetical protein MYOV003v1_p0064 [Vibrio phage 207E48.1]|nr:hypothetical protein MYOV003v1_p0064 [Vibrio phage 207E48.1]